MSVSWLVLPLSLAPPAPSCSSWPAPEAPQAARMRSTARLGASARLAIVLLALGLQGALAGPGRRLQGGAEAAGGGAAPASAAVLPPPPAARPQRRFAVLSSAGDHATWPGWVAGCEARSFDLLLLYYGANPGFECPECAVVWPRRGAKWRTLALLLQEPEAWALVRPARPACGCGAGSQPPTGVEGSSIGRGSCAPAAAAWSTPAALPLNTCLALLACAHACAAAAIRRHHAG